MSGEDIEISVGVLLLGVGLQIVLTFVSIFTPTWTRRSCGEKIMFLVVISLYAICAILMKLADEMLPDVPKDSYLLVWLVVKNFLIGLTLGFIFELVGWFRLKLR